MGCKIRNKFLLLTGVIFLMYFVLAAFPGVPEVIVIDQDGAKKDLHYFNKFLEDSGSVYNITINNTWGAGDAFNISQVNITLPSGWIFNLSSNQTGNLSSPGNGVVGHSFINTSDGVLSWFNGTGGYLINGTGILNETWFAFNATAPDPGFYNLTVLLYAANGSNYSVNISVTINDTTAPSTVAYQGLTPSNNSNLSQSNIFVNLSLADNGNITYVNLTLFNSSMDFINSTRGGNLSTAQWFNFTGLSDGVYFFNISVRDSYNNTNESYMRRVILDTTIPSSVNVSCSPASVTIGSTVTCTCSAADSFTNISTISLVSSPNTSVAGNFSITCTATDYAGNSRQSSTTYKVLSSSGGSTTNNGGSTTVTWKNTYNYADDEFKDKEPFFFFLSKQHRVKLRIGREDHFVGVLEITDTTVRIQVSSDPVEATLNIGDERRFDVTDDGYYDFKVLLNSIEDDKANITISSIYEEITEETETEEQGKEQAAAGSLEDELIKQEQRRNSIWLWVLISIVVISIVIWIVIRINQSKS